MSVCGGNGQRLPAQIVEQTESADGIASLILRTSMFSDEIKESRRAHETLEWSTDLGHLVAYAAVSLVLSPLRRRYPAVFLLTNDTMRLDGTRYGSFPGFRGSDGLIRDRPRAGVRVDYRRSGDFRQAVEFESLLVDLDMSDLADMMPLMVGDVPDPVTYAFILQRTESSLDSIVRATRDAKDKHSFEARILDQGGAIYCWLEEPYFKLVLRKADVDLLKKGH